MSEHHQFLFPRDLHLPPPDWRALEARLLEGGYVLEPRGQSIPQRALINLSFGLASLHEGSYQYDEHMRTPGDVIALYARAGYLPPDIPIRHNDTMEETVALLASHGVTLGDLYADDEGGDWHSPQYCLGPAAREYLSADVRADHDADPRSIPLMLLAYDGPSPRVAVGENLCEPSLPGSDEPLESCRRSVRISISSEQRMRIRACGGTARRLGGITGSWSWIGISAWRWGFGW